MNVLISSTSFIPSVILCGHAQLEYLSKQNKINYRFVEPHFVSSQDIHWSDIIVFLRSDSDEDAYISKIAKKAGKHLVYVLDDDILNVPNYLSSAPYYLLPSTQKNIKKIMSNCAVFLTPSPVLFKKYGINFKSRYLIDEPSLNAIDKKQINEKIKIGFAGSIDRTQDLNNILEEAITKIVKKYKDRIEIEIMGAKPDFVDTLHLTHIPYQDGYDTYTAYMAGCNWDIGLAPMPSSKFHVCKYFNKYIEYASFGIAGVYSNLQPYTYGVKNEENGLLVNNTTQEWVNAISRLIEDNELRKKISNNCLKSAKEEYNLELLSNDYLQKITYDFNPTTNKTKIPSLFVPKTIFFIKRVFRKIKEKGFAFLPFLIKKVKKKLIENKQKKQYIKNTNKIKEIIFKEETCCIIASYEPEINNDYNNRVKQIDNEIIEDCFAIYLNGENKSLEYLKTEFIDEKHCLITFNSYDIKQTNEVLDMVQKSKNCLIHGVTRFTMDKISNEMFKLFDLNDVLVICDMHGNIPEEYHKQNNVHAELITNEIEKTFIKKADVIICENKEQKRIFTKKYGNIERLMIVKN